MLTQEKIEEWLKEVEQRPESAVLILRYITERLRELSTRNEQLLTDNIALQSSQRVEEYKKRIAHLEYQLELLRRQLGGADISQLEAQPPPEEADAFNFLAYQARGRILRMEFLRESLPKGVETGVFASIQDDLAIEGESARLLIVPSHEELLLFFTSGRVSSLPVIAIPAREATIELNWKQSALPNEARSGEKLACLMPLTSLPLTDQFIQVSRRGCVKKTMTSMAENILSNRFIGKGVIHNADQPFEMMLARNGDRIALVTWEGHVLVLDVDSLSYAAEERIRLEVTDHVVAAFTVRPGSALLALTQNGKILQRELDSLEPAKSPLAKGIPLIPPARLEKGTRLIGAGAVQGSDRCLALHRNGDLSLHAIPDLIAAGVLQTAEGLLALAIVPDPGTGIT